jgi:hypothetical protein
MQLAELQNDQLIANNEQISRKRQVLPFSVASSTGTVTNGKNVA